MTKYEAIEYGMRWKNAICDRGDTECSEAIQFLNMAIEALEQDEIIRCKNCRHDNNCEIQYSAQAGSKFFCGLAERREE